MDDREFIALPMDTQTTTPEPDVQTVPAMAERQLRALSRKHLLMVIRDCTKELEQVAKEKEELLMAYRAGLSESLMDTRTIAPKPDGQTEPVMTERQLRALSRKHLLMMIRDLEKELTLARKEKEEMLLAYRANAGHKTVKLKSDKPNLPKKYMLLHLLPGKTLRPCGANSFRIRTKE